MELPKRARTADWENSVLTLGREKQFGVPELTTELMERLNGWYQIEILGGEILQDGDYEPAFEFMIQPAAHDEKAVNPDMSCSFKILSSTY